MSPRQSIELLLAIEKEFDVEIPLADERRLERVGAIQSWLVRELEHRGDVAKEDEIWARVQTVVSRQLGVARDEVIASAYLADLAAD